MIHRSLVSLHNPHSVVYISLSRQPLQLHGAASDPRGDGAPGRGTLPGAGAQQQTPLREKLLLPQERHLHTVSPPAAFISCALHLSDILLAGPRLSFLLLLFSVLLAILTGINNVVLCVPRSPHNSLSVLREQTEPRGARLLIGAVFRCPR